jgi:two-component system phosphate regulon response regulator PhoB
MEGLLTNYTERSADPANIPPPMLSARSDNISAHRILIIEADVHSAQTLQTNLTQAGFAVTAINRGEEGQAAIDRTNPHLIMLDWDLPGVITTELVRHVRRPSADRTQRLMALSTFAGEQQIVSGLELGLDDYVVKPFSAREVVARVRALLRPLGGDREDRDHLEFHRLRMDTKEVRVTVRDRAVSLRAAEFRLLEFLLRHPERAFQREHLLERVWGRDCPTEVRAVDVTIQRIRKALEPHGCGDYVQTVRGVGYRISAGAKAR